MTNHLLIGNADKTARLLELAGRRFLLIDDGPIADQFLAHFPRAKLFNVAEHSFNPLKGIDYKRARDFAATVYTASPEGKDTLTMRNGRRALARLLLDNTTRLDTLPRDDKDPGVVEALATIDDILLSPLLKRVLCNPPNFRTFRGQVVAKLDRAQLGDFDAFILASLLIGQIPQGQVIVPDGGFYLRDFHMSLIRQNRLICSVSYLAELSPKLQQAMLSIQDKTIYRTTPDDAERLVIYTRHTEPRNLSNLRGDDWLGT